MIPDEEVERVRESADIVGIISESVTLKRAGGTFRGPCPFHQGKNPNFSVDPKRRIYHCFKCGESGDVFTYVRKRLGLDWPSAVRMVAERSGITIREVSSRREGPDPREPLWEVNAAADAFFQRTLRDEPAGQAARDYLKGRNVPLELAEHYGLGFAPRDAAMVTNLVNLGFTQERMLEAGLLVQREGDSTPRPRFRGRLMFPIHDLASHVVGFGGRILGPGEPKYLNSPETSVFSKGKMLYGLNRARNAIRRADRVLLVEGYFDLLRLGSLGIDEVVAPLGTALTAEQATLIVKYTKHVFLLYDSDKAGLKATFRAGDELLRHAADVRVVTFPSGDDPDTYAAKAGRDGVEKSLGAAMDVFERKVQVLERGGWFSDLHRRRRAIDHLLPTIRAATDAVTRELYLVRASEVTGVDRQVLHGEAAAERAPAASDVRRPPEPRRPPAPRGREAPARPGPGTAAERGLLRVMITVPGQVERIMERIGPGEFREPAYREIFEELMQHDSSEGPGAVAGALSPAAAEVYETLLGEAGAIVEVDRTVSDCLAQLGRRALEERSAEIQRLLVAAAGPEKDRLLVEKQRVRQEIRNLGKGGPTA